MQTDPGQETGTNISRFQDTRRSSLVRLAAELYTGIYTLLITCADADFVIVMFDRRNKLIQIEPTSCIRLLARDAGGETEGVLLNETVPAWVVDIVVEKKLPKFIKVRII